jgi:hypothetical protein
MGFFRYSNTFSMIKFDFCRTLGILKGQIEDKKYFLEWGLNPRKYYISRAEIENISCGFWFK